MTRFTRTKYHVYAWDHLDEGAEFDSDFLGRYRSKGAEVSLAENARQSVTLTAISAR